MAATKRRRIEAMVRDRDVIIINALAVLVYSEVFALLILKSLMEFSGRPERGDGGIFDVVVACFV